MLMKAKPASKARRKTEAAPAITQTREEVIENIKRMGDLMRERERVQSNMNDAIAQLQVDDATVRVLVGQAWGAQSPVASLAPALFTPQTTMIATMAAISSPVRAWGLAGGAAGGTAVITGL